MPISDYYSNHDQFINNNGKNGASIYGEDSIINIDNSTFINNQPIHWSLICGSHSYITIQNTVFANITSRYATAVYTEEKSRLNITNSKFINLSANATAGAIGSKKIDTVTITGYSFINVTSSKNAGAVYIHVLRHTLWQIQILKKAKTNTMSKTTTLQLNQMQMEKQ